MVTIVSEMKAVSRAWGLAAPPLLASVHTRASAGLTTLTPKISGGQVLVLRSGEPPLRFLHLDAGTYSSTSVETRLDGVSTQRTSERLDQANRDAQQ
jgi:hypothetical protein